MFFFPMKKLFSVIRDVFSSFEYFFVRNIVYFCHSNVYSILTVYATKKIHGNFKNNLTKSIYVNRFMFDLHPK